MIPIILATMFIPLMMGSLAFSVIKWREGRDRAVYYRRTGRIPF